jgi:enoyl-CoA hydratase/carnithine racemase
MEGQSQRVLYEVTGHIAVITFNRPAQRNAFDAEMTQEMRAAMDRLEAEEEAWTGIVTGAGDRAFCAGMDLKAFAAGEGPAILEGKGGFAGFVTYPRTKPVIAAVNGAALAGGCEIVLSCDLVVAAESALFGQPEVKRGLYAGAGGAFRLPRTMPKMRAMQMLLTGEPIDAHDAYLLGFVNAVVPKDGLMEAAMDLARRICVNAPLGVRANLALARAALDMTDEELWQKNATIWQAILRSADAAEGPAAFAEKREPRWKSR